MARNQAIYRNSLVIYQRTFLSDLINYLHIFLGYNIMYETIIIGGGIAGMTAAIYAKRRKLNCVILTIDLGGQLNKINEIENWPGEESIKGTELSQKIVNQIQKFGIEVLYGQASKIEKLDREFHVYYGDKSITANSIILAFGRVPKTLGIIGEDHLAGKGVSYCATCDAPFFKDKIVTVMGGGNSAMDATILLSKIASKVYLINRSDQFRADGHLVDKIELAPNVEIIPNESVSEVKGESILERIVLSGGREIETSGLFVEVGYVVNNSLVNNIVECDNKGNIIVNKKQATSTAGIYAAGDMTDITQNQLVIAAGEGAVAALEAYNFLQAGNL